MFHSSSTTCVDMDAVTYVNINNNNNNGVIVTAEEEEEMNTFKKKKKNKDGQQRSVNLHYDSAISQSDGNEELATLPKSKKKGVEVPIAVKGPPTKGTHEESVEKMTGYLEKRGKRLPTWKRYWFVLDGQLLLYYRSELDYLQLSPCCGSLTVSSVRPTGGASSLPQLEVHTRTQTVLLRAKDQTTLESWMQALLDSVTPSPSGAPNQHFRYSMASLPTSNTEALSEKPEVEEDTEEPVLKRIKRLGGLSYGPLGSDVLSAGSLRHVTKSDQQGKINLNRTAEITALLPTNKAVCRMLEKRKQEEVEEEKESHVTTIIVGPNDPNDDDTPKSKAKGDENVTCTSVEYDEPMAVTPESANMTKSTTPLPAMLKSDLCCSVLVENESYSIIKEKVEKTVAEEEEDIYETVNTTTESSRKADASHEPSLPLKSESESTLLVENESYSVVQKKLVQTDVTEEEDMYEAVNMIIEPNSGKDASPEPSLPPRPIQSKTDDIDYYEINMEDVLKKTSSPNPSIKKKKKNFLQKILSRKKKKAPPPCVLPEIRVEQVGLSKPDEYESSDDYDTVDYEQMMKARQEIKGQLINKHTLDELKTKLKNHSSEKSIESCKTLEHKVNRNSTVNLSEIEVILKKTDTKINKGNTNFILQDLSMLKETDVDECDDEVTNINDISIEDMSYFDPKVEEKVVEKNQEETSNITIPPVISEASTVVIVTQDLVESIEEKVSDVKVVNEEKPKLPPRRSESNSSIDITKRPPSPWHDVPTNNAAVLSKRRSSEMVYTLIPRDVDGKDLNKTIIDVVANPNFSTTSQSQIIMDDPLKEHKYSNVLEIQTTENQKKKEHSLDVDDVFIPNNSKKGTSPKLQLFNSEANESLQNSKEDLKINIQCRHSQQLGAEDCQLIQKLSNNKRCSTKHHSADELDILLRQLTMITNSPLIKRDGDFHSDTLRRRRHSDPDYDIPRPHNLYLPLLRAMDEEHQGDVMEATRFFTQQDTTLHYARPLSEYIQELEKLSNIQHHNTNASKAFHRWLEESQDLLPSSEKLEAISDHFKETVNLSDILEVKDTTEMNKMESLEENSDEIVQPKKNISRPVETIPEILIEMNKMESMEENSDEIIKQTKIVSKPVETIPEILIEMNKMESLEENSDEIIKLKEIVSKPVEAIPEILIEMNKMESLEENSDEIMQPKKFVYIPEETIPEILQETESKSEIEEIPPTSENSTSEDITQESMSNSVPASNDSLALNSSLPQNGILLQEDEIVLKEIDPSITKCVKTASSINSTSQQMEKAAVLQETQIIVNCESETVDTDFPESEIVIEELSSTDVVTNTEQNPCKISTSQEDTLPLNRDTELPLSEDSETVLDENSKEVNEIESIVSDVLSQILSSETFIYKKNVYNVDLNGSNICKPELNSGSDKDVSLPEISLGSIHSISDETAELSIPTLLPEEKFSNYEDVIDEKQNEQHCDMEKVLQESTEILLKSETDGTPSKETGFPRAEEFDTKNPITKKTVTTTAQIFITNVSDCKIIWQEPDGLDEDKLVEEIENKNISAETSQNIAEVTEKCHTGRENLLDNDEENVVRRIKKPTGNAIRLSFAMADSELVEEETVDTIKTPFNSGAFAFNP